MAREGASDAARALETLAWCHVLPQAASMIAPEVGWRMVDALLAAMAEAEDVPLDGDPLVHQLLAGELPLSMVCLMPELVPHEKLLRSARRALSAGLVRVLDASGMPHGRHVALWQPLLACWTRCRAIGDALPGGCWSEAAQRRYRRFVASALRFTRAEGTFAFAPGSNGPEDRGLLDVAVRLGGDERQRAVAGLLWPRRGKAAERASSTTLPRPAAHSERAAVAVLRPRWSPGDPHLTLVYPGNSVRSELVCGREVLWSGTWGLEVLCDGQRIKPGGDWQETCWVSDEEVDYLELQADFGRGVCVERQVLLARKDGLLFLADAILGRRAARWEYRAWVPIGGRASFQAAPQTREGFLVGRRARALVLPLALPEWRSEAAAGSLEQTERGLELTESGQGSCLFVPLFLDLRPRRFAKPFTWRQLTVGENLTAQPRDVAVGYRVLVGRQQWLIYRALARKGNRTLLGHNLSSEFLMGRFPPDGQVKPLLEIE